MVGETTYEMRLRNDKQERFLGTGLNESHLLGYVATVVATQENRRTRFVTGTRDSRGVVIALEGGPLQSRTIDALEDCLTVKRVKNVRAETNPFQGLTR